jgi:hypothetical protein
MPGARMNDHPGRLVEHHHVGIFVERCAAAAPPPAGVAGDAGSGTIDDEALAPLDRRCSRGTAPPDAAVTRAVP